MNLCISYASVMCVFISVHAGVCALSLLPDEFPVQLLVNDSHQRRYGSHITWSRAYQKWFYMGK